MARKTTKRSSKKAAKTVKTAAPAAIKKTPRKSAGFPPLGRALLWLDDKRNVGRVVYALYALCACLFAADFFYEKHVEFDTEKIPGFYALYGFLMCAALVICAKGMRVFLKRPEDYYAPRDVQSEDYPADQLERIDHDA